MNFSVSFLFASFVFSVIGFWAFRQGKAKGNIHFVVVGILLMVYTYVTSNVYLDWGIGAALCGLLYYSRNEE